MANKIVNAYMNEYGLVYLRGVVDSECIKITEPYLTQLTALCKAFSSARTEASNGQDPPFNSFIQTKIDALKLTYSEKLKAFVVSAVELASQQSGIVSNMQANAFVRTDGASAVLQKMDMREIRDRLFGTGHTNILQNYTGSDLLIATAILRSPVSMGLTDAEIERGIEQRMGPDNMDYKSNMSEAIATIQSWLTRCYTFIGVAPDPRIEHIKL